jgi:hypothetical protein
MALPYILLLELIRSTLKPQRITLSVNGGAFRELIRIRPQQPEPGGNGTGFCPADSV